jgi:hypothetical protein
MHTLEASCEEEEMPRKYQEAAVAPSKGLAVGQTTVAGSPFGSHSLFPIQPTEGQGSG